jgi:hypothetical protein
MTERDPIIAPPRRHEARAGRCEDDEHILLNVSITSRPLPEDTDGNEAIYPCPHGVVWQLSPSALVHNRSLVYTTTHKVHHDRDQDDDAEDAAGTQRLLGLMYAPACEWRPALEEVCALVYGCNERYTGLCQ